MEHHYERKKEYSQRETSMSCSGAPSVEETENLLREIYSNIASFKKLVYEDRK